jgi:hypothetical protein
MRNGWRWFRKFGFALNVRPFTGGRLLLNSDGWMLGRWPQACASQRATPATFRMTRPALTSVPGTGQRLEHLLTAVVVNRRAE